jgi:hypothetical protein
MDKKAEHMQNAQINSVLGKFILFFGIVVLISIFYTETIIGVRTNLVAGLILCFIGGGMFYKAEHRKVNLDKTG